MKLSNAFAAGINTRTNGTFLALNKAYNTYVRTS